MGKILDALNAWAGLLGACGVAAAAAAAHLSGGEHMRSVALILLVHAAALLGLTARAREDSYGARLWLASALAIALGAALFSADVTLLTLRGARLFPMAAPTGGTTLILGWLIACAAGLADFFGRYR
jgi:uncharacterized membrane protein YgdD (TMEM256/DUF423 family)